MSERNLTVQERSDLLDDLKAKKLKRLKTFLESPVKTSAWRHDMIQMINRHNELVSPQDDLAKTIAMPEELK